MGGSTPSMAKPAGAEPTRGQVPNEGHPPAMRVADYIAHCLAGKDLTYVFMVTGGGAMHLNDAFGRRAGLTVVCLHHEQACAMAAEAYARLGGKPAILNVTTGPGGINALNGAFGAYTDSLPMIVISGQVRRDTIARSFPIELP